MRWIKKKKNLLEWHKWYAWYPVKVEEDGEQFKKVWLESVMRKKIFYIRISAFHLRWWYFDYKTIGKE